MDFAVRGLALRLRVQLKPKSGPTPLIPTIVAAILAARDPSLGARGACRLVPDLDGNSAHSRVAKLVRKVLPLLADDASGGDSRAATMPLNRKVLERLREKRRDRSQRSRPSLVDERKRRANQRLQSPTPPRTKAESATRAALIASKHALCVTDPKAVYPEGAWACIMCKRTAHSWWRMWHCTRDGCNHHECDACHEYCPRERAACVEHALPPYWKEAKAPHGHLHAGRSFYYRQYNGSIEKQWECP